MLKPESALDADQLVIGRAHSQFVRILIGVLIMFVIIPGWLGRQYSIFRHVIPVVRAVDPGMPIYHSLYALKP